MLGSTNNFGQSTSNNPFGTQTQSVFGQKNNAISNPFAPKPFGASTTFGAQAGSSMFGGTSTGVFGAPQASSSPFGASSQAFGSPTPAFGSSPSPFGATSAFGQNSFGVSTPQSGPFGNTTQQSQPAFGNSTFGSSTPFGASNTSAFGASTTPTFGTTSTPGFGATNTPAFGTSSTPAFGSTNTPAFGASSTPSFGTTNSPGFGASSTLAFGNNAFGSNAFGSNAFGNNAQNTSAFGTPSTSAFGASSTPAFGASSTPAFGASSTPSFSFGSSPAFGNGSFASTQSPFGTQGAQASITTFGGQQGGSRVMPYTPTAEVDSGTGSSQPAGKVQSISAMPVHNNKCHEELRWEDYQKGDKGGQRPSGQSAGVATFGVPNPQPNLFTQSPTFSQTFTNPFGQNTPTPTSNFAPPFCQNTTPPVFRQTPSTITSGFGSSPGFATTTSQPFSSSSTPGFSSSQSIFSSAPAQVSTPTYNSNFNNSQSSPLFSSNPSLGQQTSSAFTQQQTSSSFGQPQATSAINTNPGFAQTSNFSTPSTGFKNMFSSSSSLTTSTSPFSQTTPASLTQPFQSAKPTQPTQPSGAFSFNNFGQTQTANTAGFTNGMGSFSQGNFGPAPANNAVMQPTPISNPFGTLPALPQVSITQGGSSPSIQYGISSLPIVDKPALARVSSLLTSRHLLQRRVRLPARKYHPNDDSPKVPFFRDEVENSYTPKADAVFIPRENPRALFIRPVEKEKSIVSKDRPTPLQENVFSGKSSNGVTDKEDVETSSVKTSPKQNGADIASLLPKLHHAEYFTEPRVQELAAKEKANPGYCSRVKDFVIGRHGYGNIKFLGETDVRSLDIETMVQFNNREVIVYMDESLKPPVGHGLNKPSEVTLLNIKCMDKKTGKQVKEEGARLDKYKEMLKRKGEEQGAEFVSYDCVSGEWKFKVQHF